MKRCSKCNCILSVNPSGESDNAIAVKIKNAVAEAFGFTIPQLEGRARPYRLAQARHFAFALMHQLTKMGFVEIGGILNRDHGTAMYGVEKVTWLQGQDAELYDKIKAELTKQPSK